MYTFAPPKRILLSLPFMALLGASSEMPIFAADAAEIHIGDVVEATATTSLMNKDKEMTFVLQGQRMYAVKTSPGWVAVTVPGGPTGSQTGWVALKDLKKVPGPEEPQDGKGLILGRVIVRHDGFLGDHGNTVAMPFDIEITQLNVKNGAETRHVVKADINGHFLIENVLTDGTYYYAVNVVRSSDHQWGPGVSLFYDFERHVLLQTKKGVGRVEGFEGHWEHLFSRVLDLGMLTISVRKGGVSIPHFHHPFASLALVDAKGGWRMDIGKNDDSLGRHNWFLSHFSTCGWASLVQADMASLRTLRRSQ